MMSVVFNERYELCMFDEIQEPVKTKRQTPFQYSRRQGDSLYAKMDVDFMYAPAAASFSSCTVDSAPYRSARMN